MNDDTGYRSGHPTTREGIYESLTHAKLNHVHRPDRWPSTSSSQQRPQHEHMD